MQLGQAIEGNEALALSLAQLNTLTVVAPDGVEIPQAPDTLTLLVMGGIPGKPVTVQHDSDAVATGILSSDGYLELSVAIHGDLGTVGDHLLQISQTDLGASTYGEITYSVLNDPEPLPQSPTADAPPVAIGGSVRKWVFQDASPGGLGSYILPINPRTAGSPHHEHAISSRHTTSHQGVFHLSQAAMMPKEWQFGGYCPTEEMAEKLWQYRELNRRIYVIDNHGRAWKVAITHLELIPRLQHTFNGVISDWGSDWTMTVTVLDQEPVMV